MNARGAHSAKACARWFQAAVSLYLGIGWSVALGQTPEEIYQKIMPAIQYLLFQEDRRGVYYIYADHLDTPRLITNQAGQSVWKYDNNDPFGGNAPDENPSGLGAFEFPLRDKGTYADKETNLVYNWNRYRDPPSGRFIQADPLGINAGDISLYVLRSNNPLSFSDPKGLQQFPLPSVPPETLALSITCAQNPTAGCKPSELKPTCTCPIDLNPGYVIGGATATGAVTVGTAGLVYGIAETSAAASAAAAYGPIAVAGAATSGAKMMVAGMVIGGSTFAVGGVAILGAVTVWNLSAPTCPPEFCMRCRQE